MQHHLLDRRRAFPVIIAKTHGEKWWFIGLGVIICIGILIYYFTLEGMATAAGVAIVPCFVGGALPLAKVLPAELPDIKKEHHGHLGHLPSQARHRRCFGYIGRS